MKIFLCFFVSGLSLASINASAFAQGLGEKKTLVIAHRGASAYLPEHSQAGAAMAHATFCELWCLNCKNTGGIKFINN